MSRSTERALFWLVIAILLATHMLRFGQSGRPLVLGWMPINLAYRLGWLATATAAVFWMTARLWPDRD